MSNSHLHYTRLCFRAAVLLATTILILGAFPFNRSLIHSLVAYGRYPPLYPHYRELQLELPHYQSYEHSDVKYLWSPNHPAGVGWGNIMQDYILSYVIAYASNRSFVFDDYTWAVDDAPYSHFNGKLIPSRVPLSALIDGEERYHLSMALNASDSQGPLAGGVLPPGDSTPRAVYKEFFQRVCPEPTVLRLSDVSWNDSDTVKFVVDKWVERIASIEDPCLQFEETSPDKQIFNFVVYAQKDRLLSIWPYMSKLPVLSHWEWSSMIHDAFEANHDVFYPPASSWSEGERSRVEKTMAGLLVIHVRRGDFAAHCQYLARFNADWNTFNSFPELPDKYDPIQSNPRLSSENHEVFMNHCYPSKERIIEKVKAVREELRTPLEYIYIMTNGDSKWVTDLKMALQNLGGWEHIRSSLDLNLTWEQKFVAQAVDMLVAQRAQVFVGNGWSSLSSNIVMLRTVDGLPAENNRFW